MESVDAESVFRHDRLLGTVVDVRVRAADPDVRTKANQAIVDEIDRLEGIFSVYDHHSELNRWKRDEVVAPSSELTEVMSAALHWQLTSAGAFNPMAGLLTAAWRRAEQRASLPHTDELREIARSIETPRFQVSGGELTRLDDCSSLNLNAIAKGFIVDRAASIAVDRIGASMVLVSAGGDLLHRGTPTTRVGIENPLRPYDNEPPLTVIDLAEAGLATSGGSRRGVHIGGEWFSHVIDPRSGEPVTTQASITVIAPTAMDADVVATVLGVEHPADAVDASESDETIACLVVGPDGAQRTNRLWRERFGPSTTPG